SGRVASSAGGGVVGTKRGTIAQSYGRGCVTATGSGTDSSVGGLVGTNSGTITQSYATGFITAGGSGGIGGLVGRNNNGSVSDSYWDTQTSGQMTSARGARVIRVTPPPRPAAR